MASYRTPINSAPSPDGWCRPQPKLRLFPVSRKPRWDSSAGPRYWGFPARPISTCGPVACGPRGVAVWQVDKTQWSFVTTRHREVLGRTGPNGNQLWLTATSPGADSRAGIVNGQVHAYGITPESGGRTKAIKEPCMQPTFPARSPSAPKSPARHQPRSQDIEQCSLAWRNGTTYTLVSTYSGEACFEAQKTTHPASDCTARAGCPLSIPTGRVCGNDGAWNDGTRHDGLLSSGERSRIAARAAFGRSAAAPGLLHPMPRAPGAGASHR